MDTTSAQIEGFAGELNGEVIKQKDRNTITYELLIGLLDDADNLIKTCDGNGNDGHAVSLFKKSIETRMVLARAKIKKVNTIDW